jgi:hypothetical protein
VALLLSILVGIIFLAVIIGSIIFLQSRKTLREQKNFERGLKMIPMLIRLPPSSEDTDVGSRDVRDVTDENISKAQIVYGIIASTLKKGFKSNFYGQRHVSFEIVGHRGFINFYVVVPVVLVDVIRQAVVSAYPSAILEETTDPNIFSPVGHINGTLGGELTLKENFAYPISTYREIKRDPMQSVLNALSGLDKEDGVGIQILMRPARDGWRRRASDMAAEKRKGEKKKSGIDLSFWWVKQAFIALIKPPEDKSKDSGGQDISSYEQSVADSIDEKTKYPGFETSIRVISSSNIASRAQTLLSSVVASFALFDAPGKNGFKYAPAEDMESFSTAYIMRFFPPHHGKNILNAVEMATLFHFPQQEDIPTSQLTRQDSKQVDGPRNMPDSGLLLGYNVFRGIKKPIRLDDYDRQKHMYVVGQTGVGKSVFLENLALQDMLNGDGFAFIDPHGDTAEKLLSMVPKERTEDVIYFCPADTDYPLGLNIFEAETSDQQDFVIQEVINVLYKLYDPQRQGIIGPRYEHLFRNAALTVMSGPDGGTFIDIPKLFRDRDYVNQKLKHVTDQNVLEFWQKEMPQSQRSNEFGDVVSWFVSKFGAFLSNSMMRNIIGQTKSSFDLRDIMDNKKILLVNLSKGRTGELNSRLLGMMFVMKFQAAAMSRANIPEEDRVDFALYVDEFQNFSTDSFATIMSEARKYHLNLIVANQFTTQLTEEIRDAVFGNMGTIVSFRVGQNDVETLSRYFQPSFDPADLLRVPNYNAIVRTLIGGVPTQPFSMATIPPLGSPNKQLGGALKQLSAAKFGKPRQTAEREIFARLKTDESQSAAFPGRPAAPQTSPAQGRPMAPQTGAARPAVNPNASFLDQWKARRQSGAAAGAQSQKSPFSKPPAVRNQASIGDEAKAVARNINKSPAADNKAAQQPAAHASELKIPRDQPSAQTDQDTASEDTITIDKEGNFYTKKGSAGKDKA